MGASIPSTRKNGRLRKGSSNTLEFRHSVTKSVCQLRVAKSSISSAEENETRWDTGTFDGALEVNS